MFGNDNFGSKIKKIAIYPRFAGQHLAVFVFPILFGKHDNYYQSVAMIIIIVNRWQEIAG